MPAPALRRRAALGVALAATAACSGDQFVDPGSAPHARAFGLWSPGQFDSCTKEQHDAYAVIRETIRTMDKVAIGRVVLTNREHIIALEPLENGLMGTLLRYPYEVRNDAEYFAGIARDLEYRRDVLVECFGRAGWPVPEPQASMFAWVPIPERFHNLGAMEFSKRLLTEALVAVAPGVQLAGGRGEPVGAPDVDGLGRAEQLEGIAADPMVAILEVAPVEAHPHRPSSHGCQPR